MFETDGRDQLEDSAVSDLEMTTSTETDLEISAGSSKEVDLDFPLNILADDAPQEEILPKQLEVNVELNFPSGPRNKPISDNDVKSIVKNFALSNFKAAVHLMFKSADLKPFVREAVSTAVTSEFKEYCHSDNSLLKHTSPAELASFSNKLVCHEVSVMCPLWDSAMRAAAGCNRSEAKSDKAVNVLALCSAVLAKFRNERMSALAYRISVILLHSGAKSHDFMRLNRLGLCMSHDRTVSKQKAMAKEHDSHVLTWKAKLETTKKCELLLEEIHTKQEPKPSEQCEENDMEIDVYDLRQEEISSYDNYSEETYHMCSKELESFSTAVTPAALEMAISSVSDKLKSLPRYRLVFDLTCHAFLM